LVKSVVSQNVDGLHLRSGVPHTKLCELHGNVFREVCSACAKEYLRSFDVTEKSSYHRHATPRLCATRSCRAPLADTIVYFGERVNDTVLEEAKQQACNPPTKLARRLQPRVVRATPHVFHAATSCAPRCNPFT
jgi:NAD-dependent SIR2 family protein deacetylase|tara:strand:- start:82 stop:483 length:402 start_codon:yes stop_codon:yes gene_type:complete